MMIDYSVAYPPPRLPRMRGVAINARAA